MKKLLSVVVFSIFLSSCGIGVFENRVSPRGEEEKIFELAEFKEVKLGNAYEVEIIPSSVFKVTALGDGRDIDDLDLRIKESRLTIDYLSSGWFSGNTRYRMKLIIETPTLDYLDLSGASDTQVYDFDSFENMNIDLSGASKLRFKSVIGELKMKVSGASTANFFEKIEIATAKVSGASTFNALDKEVSEAVLDVSGASRVNIAVGNKLDVDASGASTVRYRGEPEVKQKTSGASKVLKD